MAAGAASLKKTSWYCNIIILLGVEDHPNYRTKKNCNDNDFGQGFRHF